MRPVDVEANLEASVLPQPPDLLRDEGAGPVEQLVPRLVVVGLAEAAELLRIEVGDLGQLLEIGLRLGQRLALAPTLEEGIDVLMPVQLGEVCDVDECGQPVRDKAPRLLRRLVVPLYSRRSVLDLAEHLVRSVAQHDAHGPELRP